MITPQDLEKIKDVLDTAQRIVIIQADNPDADSLGSALALEEILGKKGKEPILYCSVDAPGYLRYLKGWDRVQKNIPQKFDASIIVDASTITLLDKLVKSGESKWVAAKPCVVLDHHGTVNNPISFSTITINDSSTSSTGELIYTLFKQLDWELPVPSLEFLMTSILGDTQGLTNNLAKATTYEALGAMVRAGVDRPKIEELRRESSKMPKSIYAYKAELISRTEFYVNDQLVLVTIPQTEINEFSPLYNPAPLIQNDMLQIAGVGVSVVIKHYDDGHITAAIRCNQNYSIGDKLAEHFGGGGHPYASGFKINSGKTLEEIKKECISVVDKLIGTLNLQ